MICNVFRVGLLVGLILYNSTEASAEAQYLGVANVPIAQHKTKRSERTFTRNTASAKLSAWGRLFSPAGSSAQEKQPHDSLISYKELPRCSDSEVHRTEIGQSRDARLQFDVLYYDKRNQADRRRAQTYRRQAVVYHPGLVRTGKSGDTDLRQTLARFAGIECLPTRFRFVVEDGKRIVEYRSGTPAWDGD